MTGLYPLALLSLLGFCIQPACAEEKDEKKAAELKWAKQVADDFFDAAFKGCNLAQAETLLDSSLKKSIADLLAADVRGWLADIANHGFHDPAFESEEIASDLDEASFKGTLKSGKSSFRFSLRVSKDKESGKWRICHFLFKEQVEKK
jgi:hypothetical protein